MPMQMSHVQEETSRKILTNYFSTLDVWHVIALGPWYVSLISLSCVTCLNILPNPADNGQHGVTAREGVTVAEVICAYNTSHRWTTQHFREVFKTGCEFRCVSYLPNAPGQLVAHLPLRTSWITPRLLDSKFMPFSRPRAHWWKITCARTSAGVNTTYTSCFIAVSSDAYREVCVLRVTWEAHLTHLVHCIQ